MAGLRAGEDFIQAAIRETKEETGYDVQVEDLKFAGLGRLEGGYSEDWLMCFFKIEVGSKKIPLGSKTDDGDLIWINKDKVLDSEYEAVDDLKYYFKDIVKGTRLFFMNAQMNDNEKVESVSISRIKR